MLLGVYDVHGIVPSAQARRLCRYGVVLGQNSRGEWKRIRSPLTLGSVR